MATELGAFVFDGQIKGNEITGDVQTTLGRGTFRLLRTASIDPQIYDLYSGSYQLESGKFIHMGRGFGGGFTLTDYE